METKVKIHTKILQTGRNTTGIEVSEDVVQKFNAGKRVQVKVTLNGYTYRSTIASMGGSYLISVSSDVRNKAKIIGGDELDIEIELDQQPREVALPEDFKSALESNLKAKEFFETLSFSGKQKFVLSIEQAKTEETRMKRIQKVVSDLEAGKK